MLGHFGLHVCRSQVSASSVWETLPAFNEAPTTGKGHLPGASRNYVQCLHKQAVNFWTGVHTAGLDGGVGCGGDDSCVCNEH